MNKIKFLLLIAIFLMTACQEDAFEASIFNQSATQKSEFDQWLQINYVDAYNIDFQYRMQDIESDMTYNLVPASLAKSQEMAKLVKYLWLGAYDEMCGSAFMRQYGPRIIMLVGSSAINPSSNTEVLGTADKGLKVTLYKVNVLDKTDVDKLNLYYFRTMHHEFAHILQQTKEYPTDFNTITVAGYSPTGWINRSDTQANRMGFVTSYASSEDREDFVEVIANYLTRTDEGWNEILRQASFTDEEAAAKLPDLQDRGTGTGEQLILQKLKVVKEWLQEDWNINLDQLREIIKRRSSEIDSL